jgi:hypothetical protein
VPLRSPQNLENVEELCKNIALELFLSNICIFNGLQATKIVTKAILSPLRLPISPSGLGQVFNCTYGN